MMPDRRPVGRARPDDAGTGWSRALAVAANGTTYLPNVGRFLGA
jgi:hypothetical protein